jgi:hypothetical protein
VGAYRPDRTRTPGAGWLRARHEALRIEFDLDAILVVVGRLGGLIALTVEALLGLA